MDEETMVRETFTLADQPRNFSHLNDLLRARYGLKDSGKVNTPMLAVAMGLTVPGMEEANKPIAVTGIYEKAQAERKAGKLEPRDAPQPEVSTEVKALQLDLEDLQDELGIAQEQIAKLDKGVHTVAELSLLQVDDLKKILTARGLDDSGVKADLIARILE